MIDTSSEEAALAELLGRRIGAEAWDALASDGWLDLSPDSAGWELAAVAAAVAGACAVAQPRLEVGAHLTAAGVLSSAGAAVESNRRMGVLLGARTDEKTVRGVAWGTGAEVFAGWVPGLGALRVDARSAALTATPLLLLRGAGIGELVVSIDDVDVLAPGEPSPLEDSRAAFILAAETAAVSAAATEKTRIYLGQRAAFGRTLAGQQVLQHRLVDMSLNDVLSSTLLSKAAEEWKNGNGPSASWAAKLHAGDRGVWTLEQAIQLHGGIGFTEELGIGAWLRLAQRCRLLLGGNGRAAAEVVAATHAATAYSPRDWSLEFDPQ